MPWIVLYETPTSLRTYGPYSTHHSASRKLDDVSTDADTEWFPTDHDSSQRVYTDSYGSLIATVEVPEGATVRQAIEAFYSPAGSPSPQPEQTLFEMVQDLHSKFIKRS